ncbi:hypothetical protein DFJ43DRAFT_1159918 [Lentinula guzmanii]|uniref:Uncharacterized protein n=1 Tax=Lentinula guzmanii TaxID=2804957 RepID=A0AA38MVH3_9AGAR|nr:hypothetical protein DFJ43DRAFT_1159918 [Lentinula guzmanii]
MAPAKVTSVEGVLPVVPATPVRVMAKMIRNVLLVKDDLESEPDSPSGIAQSHMLPTIAEDPPSVGPSKSNRPADPSSSNSPMSFQKPNDIEDIIKKTVGQLKELSLDSLVGRPVTPLTLKSNGLIPKTTMSRSNTLGITPETTTEIQLLAALRESEFEVEYYQQLAFREQKKDGKGKGKRLMGDGLPVLLSSDEFYEKVIEFDKEMVEKERKKEAEKTNKEGRKVEIEDWKKRVTERQKAVDARKAVWAQEKADWLKEKQKWQSRKEKGLVSGRFGKPQPKLGPLPPAIPRPKVVVDVQEQSGSELGSDSSEENNNEQSEDES